jgi:hypothetical protein
MKLFSLLFRGPNFQGGSQGVNVKCIFSGTCIIPNLLFTNFISQRSHEALKENDAPSSVAFRH